MPEKLQTKGERMLWQLDRGWTWEETGSRVASWGYCKFEPQMKSNQDFGGNNKERIDSENILNIEKTGLRECTECGD